MLISVWIQDIDILLQWHLNTISIVFLYSFVFSAHQQTDLSVTFIQVSIYILVWIFNQW